MTDIATAVAQAEALTLRKAKILDGIASGAFTYQKQGNDLQEIDFQLMDLGLHDCYAIGEKEIQTITEHIAKR